jgi:bacteriocin-like protein
LIRFDKQNQPELSKISVRFKEKILSEKKLFEIIGGKMELIHIARPTT